MRLKEEEREFRINLIACFLIREENNMRILLTNDDGIRADGIQRLAKELEKEHELIIVAPDIERSAQSHAITLFKPLVIKEVELEGIKGKAYSVSGTPADCVRAGMEALADGPIDLVFSGINMGLNSGMDILYSGTVSAAIEASIYNIPSIAVSAEYVDKKVNFDIAARYASKILERSIPEIKDTDIVLNINTPYTEDAIKGIKACKVGDVIYDYYFEGKNGDGEKILQAQGRRDINLTKDTDRYYLSQGYATVTPLHYDLTNFESLEEVRSWMED